jgi:hypothetical protein
MLAIQQRGHPEKAPATTLLDSTLTPKMRNSDPVPVAFFFVRTHFTS